MKKRARRLIIVTFATAVAIAGFFWLREQSTLFNLFLPPDSLYEPLASARLDSHPGQYAFNVGHELPGQYEVVVIAPGSPGIGVPYNMEFQARIVIEKNRAPVLEKTVSTPYSQFWRNNDGGIVLVSYRVPEQVPKGEEVLIKVDITGNVASFNQTYGASALAVKKATDK